MTMMTPWSLPFLILGLHVINTVVAEMKISPQGKHVTPLMSASTSRHPRARDFHTLMHRMQYKKKMYPKKRHFKPQKLMKRMGKDFDTFLMSQQIPKDFSKTVTKNNVDNSLQAKTRASRLNLQKLARNLYYDSLSLQQSEQSSYLQNTNDSLGGINSNNTAMNVQIHDPSQAVSKIVDGLQSWLVGLGSCPVYYQWVDFGPLYWPRWVRIGSCSLPVHKNPIQGFIYSQLFNTPSTSSSSSSSSSSFSPPPSSGNPSCSWPPGMQCTHGKEKKLRLLRFTCKYYQRATGEIGRSRRIGKKNYNIITAQNTTTYHDEHHHEHHGNVDPDHHDDHSDDHDENFDHHDDHLDHHDDHLDHHDDHLDDHLDRQDDDEYHPHMDGGAHHDDNKKDIDENSIDTDKFRDLLLRFSKLDNSNYKKPTQHSSQSLNLRSHHEGGGGQGQRKATDLGDVVTPKVTSDSADVLVPVRSTRHSQKYGIRSDGRPRVRRESGNGRGIGDNYLHRHKNPHSNNNNTNNNSNINNNNHNHHHGKGHRRGHKKRRSGLRCRWVKITHPVVDDCFCSCLT